MIGLKSEEQIEYSKKAGSIVADALSLLSLEAKPGTTGLQLDKIAEDFIHAQGGIPSCKGYHGYPNSICFSVNHQAVHCVPTNTPLKEGDVVKIDLTASFKGWNADSALTIILPPTQPEVIRLVKDTQQALYKGILEAKEGNRVSNITQAVYGARNGLSVVKEFVGHGIGLDIHEAPQIPNTPTESKDVILVAGMVICIEPIFTLGKSDVYIKQGDWNTWSLDGSKVAHFEHTLLITKNGPEILTLRKDETL